MQRRWKLTLDAMAKEGVDCLVLSENGLWEGGNPGAAIYLTDIHPGNYSQYFLFSRDGISVFSCGYWGGSLIVATENILENIQVPALPSTTYAWTWHPEEMKKVILKYGYRKIGWCGMHNVTAGIYKYLTENLQGVEFCDFTDQVDLIKAVKSPYELKLWTDCVMLHDELIAAVPTVLSVGTTTREVGRKLRALAEDMGCTQLNVMVGADKTAPRNSPFPLQGKVIERGDYVGVLVEVADYRNVWAECGRTFAMGMDVSPEMLKTVKDQIEVTDLVAAESVPGASPADVFHKMNARLADLGYDPEKRFCVHGQGYEIVDRPMWVAEETMVLQENMFYANHPRTGNANVWFSNTDNYVVKRGGSVKLSRTPCDIVVVSR